MAGLVDRPRIVQLLIYHDGERGTLIHAPAGWGKTIARRQWCEVAGDATGGGGARLNLGPESTEVTWRRIRDALAGSGSVAPATPAHPAGIADALAGVRRPTFIQLDDFHLADEPLEEGIAELVAATPHWVNVVLVTRHEPSGPLAELVEAGEFRTLTSTELAFRAEEVTALSTAIHGVPVDDSIVAAILEASAGRAADVHELVLQHRLPR